MKNLGSKIKNYLVNLYKYIMYFESEITKSLKSNQFTGNYIKNQSEVKI